MPEELVAPLRAINALPIKLAPEQVGRHEGTPHTSYSVASVAFDPGKDVIGLVICHSSTLV
jgi:hypothetical protein